MVLDDVPIAKPQYKTQYNTQVGLSAFLGLFSNFFTTFISHQRRSAAGKSQRPEKCCNRWRSEKTTTTKRTTHTARFTRASVSGVFIWCTVFLLCTQSVCCFDLSWSFHVLFFYLTCFSILIATDCRQTCSVFVLILFLCVCLIKWIWVLHVLVFCWRVEGVNNCLTSNVSATKRNC